MCYVFNFNKKPARLCEHIFTEFQFNNKVADLQINKKVYPTLKTLYLQLLYFRF